MAELRLFLFEDGKQEGVPQAMTAFEAQNRVRLPDLYKRMVGRYDEANVYPNLFFPRIPSEVIDNIEEGAFFTDFYSFETSLSYWDGDTYEQGKPPGMFFLGSTGGGVEVLMSLRPADYGQILCWVHSTSDWGTDGNDETSLFKQEDSLHAFLSSLTDTPAGIGRDAIDEEELEDAVVIDLSAPEWSAD